MVIKASDVDLLILDSVCGPVDLISTSQSKVTLALSDFDLNKCLAAICNSLI